ncbi:MAG: hypothetical protein N3A63_00625 [Bacteroidetes bacterium]|nr:hypothetical protein [Bacteroidota bacterium]
MERELKDSKKHQLLVRELIDYFRSLGFHVITADGIDGYSQPPELHNDGYGDQEDKIPDIYAFSLKDQRYIIGEAKTGNNDIDTEESITQYNVFADQLHPVINRRALVYYIVPSSKVGELQAVLTHYVHRELWENIIVVQSRILEI